MIHHRPSPLPARQFAKQRFLSGRKRLSIPRRDPTEPMDLSDRIAKYAAFHHGVRELKIRLLGGYFLDVFVYVCCRSWSLQAFEMVIMKWP
ncbi:hypothetical protein LINGRAHAP2_LOCUS12339 [Linum grandiflorum]